MIEVLLFENSGTHPENICGREIITSVLNVLIKIERIA